MATFTDLTVVPVVVAPTAGDGAAAEAVHRVVKESGLMEYISTAQAAGIETPQKVLHLAEAKPLAVTRTGTATTDGEGKDVLPERWVAIAAVGALVVGFVIAWFFRQPSFTPSVGFNAFAVMYIVAQAIERVVDPITPFLGTAKPADKGANAARVDQPTAKFNRDKAVADALMKHGDEDKAATAAKNQRTVDQIRANLTLLMWGITSMLAMLASGLLGLYLLKTVGMTNVPVYVDIAVTGLAIGAGTKPLHDLISNMSASKTGKQDPSQTGKAG